MAELKTLRVCHSRDLPSVPERSFSYLYLAYDKLDLYAGQNNINENYVITSALPEEPVPGMIYILDTDGSVYRNIDYSNQKIAEIEDPSQIEYIQKAGTLFRVNANNRYMDSQTRTLTLPFNDGKYELNVSVRNDQIFDNNTIMKYNQDKERFEVYGPINEEFIDFSKPFRGANTSTVHIKTDGPRIQADVQVSKILNNLLKKASDGLYIKPTGIVSRKEFDYWANQINDFKSRANDILNNIDNDIKQMQEIISEKNINETIYQILSEKFEGIQIAIDNYAELVSRVNEIQTTVLHYTISETERTRTELNSIIKANSNWKDLDDTAETYTQEIDYYAKAEEYFYPELTDDEIAAIISTAVIQYILSEEESKEDNNNE